MTLGQDIFCLLLGLGVGLLSGMIGIGGGLLTIPALLYLYPLFWPQAVHFPMTVITGVSATQSFAGTITSVLEHSRRDNVHWRLVFSLGLGSIAGGLVGGLTTHWFSDHTLKVFYAVLLSTLVVTLSRKKPSEASAEPLEESRDEWGNPVLPPMTEVRLPPFKYLKMLGASLLIGYSAGLMGIGGAVFMIPLLNQGLGLTLRQAIGTTTGIVALTCLASFVGKSQTGIVPYQVAFMVSAGAVVGAIFGSKLGFKVSENTLRIIFLTVVLTTLLRILVELLFG